jgi:hypothetical protein
MGGGAADVGKRVARAEVDVGSTGWVGNGEGVSVGRIDSDSILVGVANEG